jgi:cell division protein ZapE
MPDTFSRYSALVASGAIEFDDAQASVARALGALNDVLGERQMARKSSALGWLLGRGKPIMPPRGLYIWGDVGRGKTMLMDLFMAGSPVRAKRRAHFHEFMADVHKRIHARRKEIKAHPKPSRGDEVIGPVAEDLANEATLLCFDEFSVTNIADAMILGRLFEKLFELGVVVVATSNVEPKRLYEGGLSRDLFLLFIEMLQERLEVLKLEARTDFRLEKLSGQRVWLTPLSQATGEAMDQAWGRLTGDAPGMPALITVLGRELRVPAQAQGVARFRFADLCEAPLGPSDYLAIAHAYHTLLIDAVPVMGQDKRNEAKRFITLIDALYDNRVKLVASGDSEPEGLYTGAIGTEAFEFARTVSRLVEMRSEDYMALPHGRPERRPSDMTGIIDT